MYADQFIENGKMIAYKDLCHKYRIALNIMEYQSIKVYIKQYRANKKEHCIEDNDKTELVSIVLRRPENKHISRMVYGLV